MEDNNLTNRKITDEGWDEHAEDWVYKGKRDAIPVPAFEQFYQTHRVDFKTALDIGCGDGRFLIPMVQDGLNVIGVEPSPKRKAATEENLGRAELAGKATIIQGDSKDLGFAKDESIDWVFSKGAIHHNTWAGIQQSFKEVERVLRSGGFFLFQCRSTNDSALKRSEMVPDFGQTAKELTGWKKGMIQHYFTKEELEKLARENGFEIALGPEERISEKKAARWWVVYRKPE